MEVSLLQSKHLQKRGREISVEISLPGTILPHLEVAQSYGDFKRLLVTGRLVPQVEVRINTYSTSTCLFKAEKLLSYLGTCSRCIDHRSEFRPT